MSVKKIETTVDFGSSIDKIWSTITDNSNFTWRTDVSKIVVQDRGNFFVEYSKKGCPTEFRTTLKIPHERYEVDFKADKVSGHRKCIFKKSNGRTKITFISEMETEGRTGSVFAGRRLKKRQKRYILDLKKALGE